MIPNDTRNFRQKKISIIFVKNQSCFIVGVEALTYNGHMELNTKMQHSRVAVYGVDHNHCEAKIKELRNHSDEFEIVGVFCESDDAYKKRIEGCSTYQDLPIFFDKEAFFSLPDIDFMLVEPAVPNLLTFAKECVERGYHMHVDKPLGFDLKTWREVLQEAEEKKLIIQPGYMYRYNKGIEYALKRAKEGALGKIFHISADMSTGLPVWSKKGLLSYNVNSPAMYIYGVHLIDLILTLMGEPNSISHYSTCSHIDGFDFLDNSFAVLAYPNGIATVKTFATEIGGWEHREFKICGDKGTIRVSPIENKMVVEECLQEEVKNCWRPSSHIVPIEEPSYRYLDQLRRLVKMIRGEENNPYSYEHEYLVQKLTLQACGYEVNDDE